MDFQALRHVSADLTVSGTSAFSAVFERMSCLEDQLSHHSTRSRRYGATNSLKMSRYRIGPR